MLCSTKLHVPVTFSVKLGDGLPVPLGLLAAIYKHEQMHIICQKNTEYISLLNLQRVNILSVISRVYCSAVHKMHRCQSCSYLVSFINNAETTMGEFKN